MSDNDCGEVVAKLASSAVRVVVLVPTFRRPELLVETLASLKRQTTTEPFAIIIADNDQPAASARTLVTIWAEANGFSDHLLYIEVHDKGVGASREAGVSAALAAYPDLDFIAMLDDDAVAEPGWIEALIPAGRQYDADLISGPVIFEFDDAAPSWFTDMSPFRVPDGSTGSVDLLRGACNSAISGRLLRSKMHAPYFDRAFSAGGEDVDFFVRAKRAGARVAWCAEAVVREKVPLDRCTLTWLTQRMFRAGQTMVDVERKHLGAWALFAQQSGFIARGLVGAGLRQWRAKTEGQRIDALMRRRLAYGRIAALRVKMSMRAG